jgi:hypothetical protein
MHGNRRQYAHAEGSLPIPGFSVGTAGWPSLVGGKHSTRERYSERRGAPGIEPRSPSLNPKDLIQ